MPTSSSTKHRWLLTGLLVSIVLALTTGSSAAFAHPRNADAPPSDARPSGQGAMLPDESHETAGCYWTRSWSGWGRSWTRVCPDEPPRPDVEPVPTTPAPEEPTPTEPTPTEPTPTEPTPDEPTTPAPSEPSVPTPSGGIASVATTGVPAGTDLTAAKGDVNITKDGTVIDGRDISGNIWIDADDVTIKNSRVAGGGFSVIQVKSGSKNVTITDVEIDGMGVQAGAMGIMGPATVTGADISGVENGLTPGSGSVLKGNYVHDLKSPGSPHYDGIQIDGGLSNITVTGNYVDLHEHSQTSAVMIDNYFGPISNIKVDGNRLIGGGYTVYSDGQFSGGPITGVSFTNNQLGKGRYGYASIVGNDPVWSGNVDVETGETVRG
ncbi:hypothetical protein GEV27_04775 [Aeromicrobium sp. S22]|nr:hypothetical protein [Aeromicrobium sp. S22]